MADEPPKKHPNLSHPRSPLLDQLAGMAAARKWGEDIARDMVDYKTGRLPWSEVDPGCVLAGPPGTGKTTFAKALAATCKLPLIATSYAHWQRSGGGCLNDVLLAMKADFVLAAANAPCVLAIDELDTLPSRAFGGQHREWYTAVTNALLEELDGTAGRPGVIVIGMCNHPKRLDPALVRAGRLDRVILVALPAAEDLPQILRFHLKDDAGRVDDLASIAVLCVGMSGADVEQLVRQGRRRARHQRRPMRRDDLIALIEAESQSLDDDTRWRVAVHEAGHAVVALRLEMSDNITASIVSRNNAGGVVSMTMTPRAVTRDGIANLLTTLLAGRAAEEVLLDSVSGGAGGDASSDLAAANRMALNAVANLGLSSSESLLWFGTSLDDGLRSAPAPLVEEVNEMLTQAYDRAQELINEDEEFVGDVARMLIEHRALTHQQILLIEERPKPAVPRYAFGAWDRKPDTNANPWLRATRYDDNDESSGYP